MNLTTRRLSWKWSGHDVIDIRDLSNPAYASAGFDLCVYDETDALVMAAGVPPGGVCNGRPCWRARSWGYQYRDRDAATFGITKISLKVAAGRTDRLGVTGAGDLLPLPATLPIAAVTVQLVRTDDPTYCWAATIEPR